MFGRLSYTDCKKDETSKHVYLLFHVTNIVGRVPTLVHFAVNRVHSFQFNMLLLLLFLLLLLCFYASSLKKRMEMHVFSSQTRITRNKGCVHYTLWWHWPRIPLECLRAKIITRSFILQQTPQVKFYRTGSNLASEMATISYSLFSQKNSL